MISADSLNTLLLRSDKPITYVAFTQSSINKFVNVYNSGAAGLIYSNYDKTGRNFKAGDLRKINRNVRG